MHSIDYDPALDPATRTALAPALAVQRGMDEAVRWLARRTPPGEVLEVVRQDELTHDFIVRLAPALFLVYEAT